MLAKIVSFNDFLAFYDTTAQRLSEILPAGYIVFDAQLVAIFIADGATFGGVPLPRPTGTYGMPVVIPNALTQAYYTGNLEIPANTTLEILAGVILEVLAYTLVAGTSSFLTPTGMTNIWSQGLEIPAGLIFEIASLAIVEILPNIMVPSVLPYDQLTQASNFTMPPGYSLYWPGWLEIGAGTAFEVGSGAVLEVA